MGVCEVYSAAGQVFSFAATAYYPVGGCSSSCPVCSSGCGSGSFGCGSFGCHSGRLHLLPPPIYHPDPIQLPFSQPSWPRPLGFPEPFPVPAPAPSPICQPFPVLSSVWGPHPSTGPIYHPVAGPVFHPLQLAGFIFQSLTVTAPSPSRSMRSPHSSPVCSCTQELGRLHLRSLLSWVPHLLWNRVRHWMLFQWHVRPGCLTSVGLLLRSLPVPVPVHLCRRAGHPVHGAACGLSGLLVRSLYRESHKGSSRQSRWSWSPSRMSTRDGSASPDGGKYYSCSCLPLQSWRADEDRQEEQSSLEFVSVVTTLLSLNKLPGSPSESRKLRGFWAAVEDDDQPASSIRCP